MRICFKLLAVATLLIYSSSAFALFDGQLFYGKRWFEDDEGDGISAGEVTLSGHVDPIPMVPVSFGLAYSMYDVNDKDLEKGSSVSGSELGLEVAAWIPMVPIVTPYFKFKYTLSGTWEAKSEGFDALEMDLSGYHINAGLEYSIIPMVSLMLEVGQGSHNLKYKELVDEDIKSQCVLLGGKVGF